MALRKYLFAVVLVLILLFAISAQAETVSMPGILATCEFSKDYIVMKPGNLDQHTQWISSMGTTADALLTDWANRGVLVQAWTKEADVCVEITAVRDDLAASYFDIDDQTSGVRAGYRKNHLQGRTGLSGYSFKTAEWKKTAQGRFLMLKYKYTSGTSTHSGYQRKTIKNGYTITIDYQVYDRNLKGSDDKATNKIWNTFTFTGTASKSGPFPIGKELIGATDVQLPAATAVPGTEDAQTTPVTEVEVPTEPSANLTFTSEPPAETNTGTFTIKGTCEPNIKLVGVCLRLSSNEPLLIEATSSSRGKFEMDVKLPQEGIWLMTVTAYRNGVTTDEYVFNTTNYQSNLLMVNLDQELPANFTITGDSLTISGKTMKQTTVQCLVDGKYDRQIRTNNSGLFSFKFDTYEEGTYNITLVFSKKNYSTRRFTSTAVRSLSDTEMQQRAVKDSIKPAYSTLSSKLTNYIGRIFNYKMYVVSYTQTRDQWIVFMAQKYSASKGYSDYVIVQTDKEPTNLEIDGQIRMYGTLVGTYQIQDSEHGDAYYPCFNLIFWSEN